MLTRTDFLLQFVWVPAKPGALPQTPEELKTKLADEEKKLTEAEKAYAADTPTAKLEEAIEAESMKKSQQFDSALDKALTGANAPGAGGNIPAALTKPGLGPPPAATPKGAGPASK
jgi:type IV pilus assembly protein PilM